MGGCWTGGDSSDRVALGVSCGGWGAIGALGGGEEEGGSCFHEAVLPTLQAMQRRRPRGLGAVGVTGRFSPSHPSPRTLGSLDRRSP